MKNPVHLKIALTYMDIFFSGKDLDRLRPLLADEFFFGGPLYQVESADEFIKLIQSDPPKDFKYELLGSFGGESSLCLFFQFSKPGVTLPMAQFFEFEDGKIREILLVFDTELFLNRS